jgi:hypothetical protein
VSSAQKLTSADVTAARAISSMVEIATRFRFRLLSVQISSNSSNFEQFEQFRSRVAIIFARASRSWRTTGAAGTESVR